MRIRDTVYTVPTRHWLIYKSMIYSYSNRKNGFTKEGGGERRDSSFMFSAYLEAKSHNPKMLKCGPCYKRGGME